MDIEVATAFYHAGGRAPNGRTRDDASKFEMYYRCMAVFFSSARRAIPEATLVLYTNHALTPSAQEWLGSSKVEIVVVPGDDFVTDPAFTNAFPGCLFTLDVLAHLAALPCTRPKQLVLLDSDCVLIRRPMRVLQAACEPGRVAALELDYDIHAMQNGQSRASLSMVSSAYYGGRSSVPLRYFGGELYALRIEDIARLVMNAKSIWNLLKSEKFAWIGPQLTEEHVMSLALNDPDLAVIDAGSSIKRIWTADNYSNVDGRERDLDIWHLPAEKKRGFAKMFSATAHDNSAHQLSDAKFLAIASQHMNLNPGALTRTLRRSRGHVKSLVKTLVRR